MKQEVTGRCVTCKKFHRDVDGYGKCDYLSNCWDVKIRVYKSGGAGYMLRFRDPNSHLIKTKYFAGIPCENWVYNPTAARIKLHSLLIDTVDE